MKLSRQIALFLLMASLVLTLSSFFLLLKTRHAVWSAAAVPVFALLALLATEQLLLRPLARLNQASEAIRSGHLDHRIGVETRNEWGSVSGTIEKLAADLNRANLSIDELSRDHSECRESEKMLKDREEHFRRLFEFSNDAVFIYDFDGKMIDVNNKASDMLAYSRDELLVIPFLELQGESELGQSKTAFKTSAKTGSLRFESTFQRKDGSLINVEISSSIVDLKKGVMQSIVSNITERKEMEKSLRESEEKFRAFMETASDLMFITDAVGHFTYVNDAMAGALGYAKAELLGTSFTEILDKDTLELAKLKRQEFADVGENLHQLVWETKHRRKISGEMKAVAIFDGDGGFRGMRGIFRDTTERKKVEESQRLAELGKLAADMAHEVNNQLMVISTRANISLLRKPKDEELVKDLKIVINQCGQVKDIVKRLLQFSKPSKGNFKEVGINECVDLVVQLVEKQFLDHQVTIKRNLAVSLPPVRADEKQIQEVFLNLMRNAFEAMEGGGTITVSTAADDDEVRIDFTDTGSGISESDLLHLFDPFFTTKEHGTGLGLSVCYGIIKVHNGDLRYKSKVGQGTSASVVLPVDDGGTGKMTRP
jgi:PAS domain S-box-containing protein